MNSKKASILAGVLFLIVGFVFVIAGIIVLKQDDGLKQRCTEQTLGTVVEVVCEGDYSTTDNAYRYAYFPVVEYQVGDRTISQRSKSGQDPPKYKVGQQVEIYYNPNNVEEFIIKGDSTPKYLGIGVIVLGSLALAFGVFASIRKARPSESSEA